MGLLFSGIGSVRQGNFTPDFEIQVLCDIFLLLSAITWRCSSLLSTRAYAQRFAQFFNLYPSFSGSNSLDIPVLKGQERQEGYRQQGLYDSRLEHDACGIGAVVDIKGASIAAPTRAHRPPTMWLAAEPAKS